MAPRPIRVDSNETDERAHDLLRSIGFSTYESRCYIALIGAGSPMNGYEVAKVSGVRSVAETRRARCGHDGHRHRRGCE